MAATSATEQGAVWDPSSIVGAPSSQLERGRPTVPPPSWSELRPTDGTAQSWPESRRRSREYHPGLSPGQPGSLRHRPSPGRSSTKHWGKQNPAENAARLAAEPEAALAPPIARAAASQQRDAESAGVARLTPGEKRCMHSMQPELASEPECLRATNEWLRAINK